MIFTRRLKKASPSQAAGKLKIQLQVQLLIFDEKITHDLKMTKTVNWSHSWYVRIISNGTITNVCIMYVEEMDLPYSRRMCALWSAKKYKIYESRRK